MIISRLTMTVVLAAVAALGCSEAPSAAQSTPASPPAASGPASASDPVVAELGGRQIRLSEVDAKWQEFDGAERARLTQLLYQNRRNMLDIVIGDMLIADAARAASVTPEAYEEREIGKRLKPVSDAEIQRFYDENKDRAQGRSLQDLRQPIVDYLQSQRQGQARAQLVEELRDKAGAVKVMLDPPRVVVDTNASDPARGAADAVITIVEFSDYQCPFCARVTPTMTQVMETYGNRVRRVFKDFPLPTHAEAPKAAEAARCAGDEGKYWEMHDRLFANQGALQVPAIKQTAAALGLSQATFDQCLDSGKYAAAVQADIEQGQKLGVNSTPTLYINGRPLIGAQPFEQFKQVIDEELARVGTK
ncbi:MAG: DsbA family protein [Acidobacteria bacterium]|nr:DsbA family protein [Acidobacteriota bacterium]